MPIDRNGLPLTVASETAAAAYRDGVDRLLAAWPGATSALDSAIAEDPDFALAHAARARLHQMFGEIPAACREAGLARGLTEHATPRERQHVEVIATAIEGGPRAALIPAEQHVDAFPRDALVLSLLLGAYGLYAFSGRADHDSAKLAICERHARHYGSDWWFLTYLGWSHTEAGNVGAGLCITERALELRCENAQGAHAVAHAHFEAGDARAARAFLVEWLPIYDRVSQLNTHLSWHVALAALESDDADAALRIYEDRVSPSVSHAAPISVLTDGASLLWRISLTGNPAPESYWRELAAYRDKAFPRAGLAFADVHAMLVGGAINDSDLERRLTELEDLHAAGKFPPGRPVIELCRGVRAFASGDHAEAIRILEPIMGEVVRIGGSHAQRELFEDTLIVACLRGGRPEKARALLDHRLHHRPSSRDERWREAAVHAQH